MSAPQVAQAQEEDEYDPFGASVYYAGGLRNEDCRLQQALAHMPAEHKAKYKAMVIEADKWADVPNGSWNRTIAYAMCHEYLMKCVKEYWATWKKRIEGEKADAVANSENVYEDGYCR